MCGLGVNPADSKPAEDVRDFYRLVAQKAFPCLVQQQRAQCPERRAEPLVCWSYREESDSGRLYSSLPLAPEIPLPMEPFSQHCTLSQEHDQAQNCTLHAIDSKSEINLKGKSNLSTSLTSSGAS